MMQTDVSTQIPQVNFHDFFLACARTSHLLDGLLHLAKEKGKVFFLSVHPLARHAPRILFVAEPRLIEEILSQNDVFPKTTRGQWTSSVFGNNFMADSEGIYSQPKRGTVRQYITSHYDKLQEDIANLTSECLALYKDGDIIELRDELKKIVMYGVSGVLIGSRLEPKIKLALAQKLGARVEGVIRSYAAVSQSSNFSLPLISRRFQRRLDKEGKELHEHLDYLISSGANGPLVGAAKAIDSISPIAALAELTMLAYYNTSITLCRVFAQLLQSEQDVRSLRAELDSGISEFMPLAQLPLLNSYIQECLRLHPPQTVIGRTSRTHYKTSKLEIPAGTIIVISSYVVHRLPELWGDRPEMFRPQRFQEIKPTPFTYLPFSRGARGCVGSEFAMMHVRAIVAKLLGKYTFESLPSAKDRRWKFGYQPFGRDSLRVRLQQRE